MSEDVVSLRQRYPAWEIEVRWTVAGTGPDARYLAASDGERTLVAWDAASLAQKIEKANAE